MAGSILVGKGLPIYTRISFCKPYVDSSNAGCERYAREDTEVSASARRLRPARAARQFWPIFHVRGAKSVTDPSKRLPVQSRPRKVNGLAGAKKRTRNRPPAEVLFTGNMREHGYQAEKTSQEPSGNSVNKRVGTAMDLRFADFQSVIDRHNRYNFNSWRTRFAQHANDLARFFKTFPGTRSFSETAVSAAIKKGGQYSGDCKSVFQPWTDWWSGKWSDGKTYYHIWDKTVPNQAAGIQLVSQSEHGFAHQDNMATMKSRGQQVDLAINVCSVQKGITGWVSKKSEELPHVGYLLNPVTLIWITESGSRYFMFFEWVDPVRGKYGIHGRPFTLTGGRFRGTTEQHYGEYTRTKRTR